MLTSLALIFLFGLIFGALFQKLRLPPLLEGVDMKDDAVTGIFESGAQKYSDGKFPLNQICAF